MCVASQNLVRTSGDESGPRKESHLEGRRGQQDARAHKRKTPPKKGETQKMDVNHKQQEEKSRKQEKNPEDRRKNQENRRKNKKNRCKNSKNRRKIQKRGATRENNRFSINL